MPETVVTSRVGYMLSILGDNHTWSEDNYYCSWNVSSMHARKVMFNCFFLPVNQWIKIARKSTFLGVNNDIFWSEIGSGFNRTAHPNQESLGVPRPFGDFIPGLHVLV